MNPALHAFKKASQWTPSVILLWAFFIPAHAQTCTTDQFDSSAIVKFVYDGDTVLLADGRKVRFIGVNTPERGKDGQPDEPYYQQARQYLIQQLQNHQQQLQMKYGQQRKDRYGRILAHPFINQQNLTQQLLAQGLGYVLTIPPNLGFTDCYQAAQHQAQQQGRGLWGHPTSQPQLASALRISDQGYRRVQGKVQRVGESRTAYWLNLSKGFALRIKKDDLGYFTAYQPRDLLHKTLIAQGWITLRKNELRMTIHHPAALTLLQTDE